MTKRTLAGLAFSLLAAPILALPAAADDAGTIAACLKSEQDGGRDGRICIGRVSDPCAEKPGSESTVGMVRCADPETKIWDDLLNAEYKRLSSRARPQTPYAMPSARGLQRATPTARCRMPCSMAEPWRSRSPPTASSSIPLSVLFCCAIGATWLHRSEAVRVRRRLPGVILSI